ncbi:diguanylate cyclase, partial [Butyricicoccus sp.]|uniref:diguanylate cyclase n=1 Tax=Butyricicoccus sp. TaxID=2049021 RepID=UPI003AB078D9
SDYLIKQVRMYTATGQREYMDNYFEELNTTRRRENALEYFAEHYGDTDAFTLLKSAMTTSQNLSYTDRYAMRLVAQATLADESSWPTEIRSVSLHDSDITMADSEKMRKAQQLVCNDQYQNMRDDVNEKITESMDSLTALTRSRQSGAEAVFTGVYRKIELCAALLVLLMLEICMITRHLVVKPLMDYGQSIRRGEIFPVVGAAELQDLALTYNEVYRENQETQKIIRHEAEHDALTGALNRGSFEKILNIYKNGEKPFAMIICDIDIFKHVNDTYGHAVGDEILKKVANLLQTTFRSVDYVCRIGGEEFAVIMVDVNQELSYTIREKITVINKQLYCPTDDLPAVSLSVGVAFTDRANPGESIFKDADKALYRVKQNGKHGCGFYSVRPDFAQLRRLPDLLFPRRCPFCGSLLGPDALQGTVCPACVPEEMRLQH